MKNIFRYGNFQKRQRPEPAHEVECEPVRTDAKDVTEPTATIRIQKRTDVQPVRTGSILAPVATPSWHSPEEQAAALLDWLQAPGGRVGEVPSRELMSLHIEMCAEMFWQQTPWIPVAKAFRKLINDPRRRYASRNSRRIVVYRIPRPAAQLKIIKINVQERRCGSRFGKSVISVSTPEEHCSGLPEQKCSSDGSKKAPDRGPFCLSRFSPELSHSLVARPWRGVSVAWSGRGGSCRRSSRGCGRDG